MRMRMVKVIVSLEELMGEIYCLKFERVSLNSKELLKTGRSDQVVALKEAVFMKGRMV